MPMLNTVTEQELAARAVAPRVTEAEVEAAIASEHCFTAAQGVLGAWRDGDAAPDGPDALALLTFCVLVLHNGFTITGTSACASACASPANFDADIGKRVARADAVRQVWPLLGFQLRDRIHHAPAMAAAVVSLDLAARTCEGAAPVHDAMGNGDQAAASKANAASYHAAIARLVP